MTDPARPESARSGRSALWWGLGSVGLVLLLGLVCWLVVHPVLEVRRVLAEKPGPEQAVECLGGRDRAFRKLALFLKMPKDWVDGYQRAQAARAVGECGRRAVPVLARALRDEDPYVRTAAIWGTAQIGPDAEDLVPLLIAILRGPDDRGIAEIALGSIGPKAVAPVAEALRSGRAGRLPVSQLIDAYAKERRTIGPSESSGIDAVAWNSPSLFLYLRLPGDVAPLKRIAADALTEYMACVPDDDDAVKAVSSGLRDCDPAVRRFTVKALSGHAQTAETGRLTPAIRADPREVRAVVAPPPTAMVPFGPSRAAVIARSLSDAEAGVRAEAAKAIGVLGDAGTAHLPELRKATADSDLLVRLFAACSAARLERKNQTEVDAILARSREDIAKTGAVAVIRAACQTRGLGVYPADDAQLLLCSLKTKRISLCPGFAAARERYDDHCEVDTAQDYGDLRGGRKWAVTESVSRELRIRGCAVIPPFVLVALPGSPYGDAVCIWLADEDFDRFAPVDPAPGSQ